MSFINEFIGVRLVISTSAWPQRSFRTLLVREEKSPTYTRP
jgi:hypothetical protein